MRGHSLWIVRTNLNIAGVGLDIGWATGNGSISSALATMAGNHSASFSPQDACEEESLVLPLAPASRATECRYVKFATTTQRW